MNFLAHIYLSGNSSEIRLGNFIGDYIKGSEHKNYPTLVQRGIILHRKIDSFTDSHTTVRQHKALFQLKYRKYAGVVTDIIYDHFLANEWYKFSELDFNEYIENTYDWLLNNIDSMPNEMKKFVHYLVRNNWLKLYSSIEGIESVLIGMSKGTSLPPEHDFAILIFKQHYEELRYDFFGYFQELTDFVYAELIRMEQLGNRY
jgi:acyl carrier protein phosphodiesterase